MTLTIGGIVDACLRTGSGRPAATLGDTRLSFGDLDAAANRCANALRGLGVRPGDIVAWWTGPALHTLAGFVGCARVGAVFAPLNPAYVEHEVRALLEYLQPRLMVSDAEPAGELGREAGIPVIGVEHLNGAPTPVRIMVDDSTPHILYLTSGSTGRPKGALVSHRASWLRASAGGGTFTTGLRGEGGVVSGFPLYHYGGWHYVLEAWQNRRPIHLVHRATAEEMLRAVDQWRAAALYAIPAVWERMLDSDRPADLSSLRHADTGTSHAPLALLERIKHRVPQASTSVLYGSTEAGRMAALPDTELVARPGSVGRAATPGALWIAEDGEVCFASPALMDGYLGLPDETAQALHEGAYHSGDVGHLDEDGYLYLTGRKQELIRTGGESVWPVEVETALRGLPGVIDLAVVGIPDHRWGEVVCAAVVVADGAPAPDVLSVQGFLDGRLARFKVPRRVATVPAIPRTPATGQVQRRALRDAIAGRPC